MKIYVFGSSGMLGSYLCKYLKNGFNIIPITRNEVDLNDDFKLILEKYNFDEDDVIINAAGIIKQREYCSEELIRVNSLFPHFLSTLNCNVIHITTDCVFSGKIGSYTEDSLHDCLDDYGKSKSLGENQNLTIIRTSIIGEEIQNKKSLVEWVKSNSYQTIKGYLNHFWNGVTCLELSKHISFIIANNSYWKGVRHYYSPDTVSKYQLVSYINEIYKLNSNVTPIMAEYCDRSLSTKYSSPIIKTIKDQIIELKNYELISVKDKLKNFPTINFISLRESEDRRKMLYKMFEKHSIDKVRPHIFEVFDEKNNIIENIDLVTNSQSYREMQQYSNISKYLGALTSHLKSIKDWYDNTDEPYAIFCEDDLSFDTVKYWNFTWDEFFNILPKNWECVQLSLSRNNLFLYYQPEVYLRDRCWDDFSCVCYLIKRSHAKNLLDNYYNKNIFNLNYSGSDAYLRPEISKDPTIETLIYTVFKNIESEGMSIFTFPLFVENSIFQSTVWNDRIYDMWEEIGGCNNEIIKWWKTKGQYINVKDFKKIE